MNFDGNDRLDFVVGLKVAIKRFAEMLVPLMVFSIVLTFANVKSYFATREKTVILMIVLTVLYFMYNGHNLLCCYEELSIEDYFFSNLAAWVLCAAVVAVVYTFGSVVFTWLFGLTKVVAVCAA